MPQPISTSKVSGLVRDSRAPRNLEDLVEQWRDLDLAAAGDIEKPFETSNTGFKVKLGCWASSRLMVNALDR